jgi:hypothetical protein
LKGGIMVAFFVRRTLAHMLVLLSIPFCWWFFPRAMLVVISLNTSMANWMIHKGIENIPDPKIRQKVELVLIPGEWLSKGIHKALVMVPREYRDRVEIIVRLKYDPGAWLMIMEAVPILLIVWRLVSFGFERHKLRRWRKSQDSRREPMF